MPGKAAPCREGTVGSEGLKPQSAWGWSPSSRKRSGNSYPGSSPCLLPQMPLGCLPWGSFVMKLPQKLLAHIQDDLQGL